MSSATDLTTILGGAVDDGTLSGSSLNALSGIQDLGAQINAGLGAPADQFGASEAIVVSVLLDDSGSIAHSGNTDAVIAGHNEVIKALKASKQSGSVLFYSRLLDGTIINATVPVAQATLLDRNNYQPRGNTPLYKEALVVCATAIATTKNLNDQGIPARSVTFFVTDGEDNASGRTTAQDCAHVIKDMLRAETNLVWAMGIGNSPAEQAMFRDVFEHMGIPANSIRTPAATEHEIRQEFAVASQSMVRASQNAAAFSQAAAGGFGNP